MIEIDFYRMFPTEMWGHYSIPSGHRAGKSWVMKILENRQKKETEFQVSMPYNEEKNP